MTALVEFPDQILTKPVPDPRLSEISGIPVVENTGYALRQDGTVYLPKETAVSIHNDGVRVCQATEPVYGVTLGRY